MNFRYYTYMKQHVVFPVSLLMSLYWCQIVVYVEKPINRLFEQQWRIIDSSNNTLHSLSRMEGHSNCIEICLVVQSFYPQHIQTFDTIFIETHKIQIEIVVV